MKTGLKKVVWRLLTFAWLGLLELTGNDMQEEKRERLYGTWIIEEVATVNRRFYHEDMYVDEYDREGEEVKACMGMEIAYGREHIRIGQDRYTDLTYSFSNIRLVDYDIDNSAGKGWVRLVPGVEEYLGRKGLYVSGEENYAGEHTLPVTYFDIAVSGLEEDAVRHAGLHGIILNEDYLLLGKEGIIFLAVRKDKDVPLSETDYLYKQMDQSIVIKNGEEWYTPALRKAVEGHILAAEKREAAGETWKADIMPPGLWQEVQELIFILKEHGTHNNWRGEANWTRVIFSIYRDKVKEMGGSDILRVMWDPLANRGTEEAVGPWRYEEDQTVPGYEKDYALAIHHQKKTYYMLFRDEEILFVEKKGEEYVPISRFAKIRPRTDGAVIPYENELYFINPIKNVNTQNYDGLEIYRVGLQSPPEYLAVRYLPEEYGWVKLHEASGQKEETEAVEAYLEGIREELTSSQTIERGEEQDIIMYQGDEEKCTEFHLDAEENEYSNEQFGTQVYKVDYANMGEPAYIKRRLVLPENDERRKIMGMLAIGYCDIGNQGLKVLSKCYLDENILGRQPIMPIQLWFKELEGKIYTFSLYYVSGYTYLLNVTLAQEGKTTQIRTELMVPQMRFFLSGTVEKEPDGREKEGIRWWERGYD